MTDYQKRVNEAAGELAVKDPSLLTKRGRLFELARELVHKSGYAYVKGYSRSKSSLPEQGYSSNKRVRLKAEERKNMSSKLSEEKNDLADQIVYKQRRRSQAESLKDFKLCDQLTEEISYLKNRRDGVELQLSNITEVTAVLC